MTPFNLILLAFFSWYVSYVLIRTSGPFRVFERVRKVTTLGGLLDCMWCLIIWVALLGYVILQSPFEGVVFFVAAAGMGMMGHRYTGGDLV